MNYKYRKSSALVFLIGMITLLLIDQRENEALSAGIWRISGISALVYMATIFSSRRGLLGFISRLIIEGLDGVFWIFQNVASLIKPNSVGKGEINSSATSQVSSGQEDSDRANFESCSKSESVNALLQRIEDKILSTSRLTNLTTDNEAELSLTYQWTIDDTGTEGPFLVINIRSEVCSSIDESSAEGFRDYVSDKINNLLAELEEEQRETLERVFGEIMFLNGTQIY